MYCVRPEKEKTSPSFCRFVNIVITQRQKTLACNVSDKAWMTVVVDDKTITPHDIAAETVKRTPVDF